jgi:predicted TIM-barrel fold metal-dependent hydrolase
MDTLMELGEGRLKKMDECGIDTQVLSLSAPGIEQIDPTVGTRFAKEVNDELAQVIKRYPGRFMGFAALAPKRPEEAADELERAVRELGFKGWNTHSNYGDSYLDDPRYRPVLERAEKLQVPIYIHPTASSIPQVSTYGFALAGAPFGFGFDVVLCLMRMILSGVFDKYPGLKIILGHLGEGLPFLMKRADGPPKRSADTRSRLNLSKKTSEYIRDNVFVTTSGNTFGPAFMCTYEALGIDRILLGTDYPYEDSADGIRFLEELPLSREEKGKIYYENASRLGMAG